MSQASALAVGSKVGRYSLVAEAPEALAAPSFVGRAEDGRLARVFVVTRAGADVDAVQRAAAPVKGLTHPCVMRLADVDPVDGRLALAYDHVDGVSLQALVTSAGAAGLARSVALRIVLDVLEGLAAVHAAGLAHGEIGPHLIFVGADGRSRVAGAGVAKGLGKALAPKTPSDRLAYIAAERVKVAAAGGAPAVDPKCDVFSAAVVAWELLAKQRLFSARLESAVIQKVLTGPVAPLAAASDEIPDGVDEALKKALERDPARRMPAARELAEALQAAFADGVGAHEDVAGAVEALAKKALEDLRGKLTKAGATSATGELVVPPARPSLPTLDDVFVESDEEPARPAASPGRPPPPPKPAAKPPVLKLPEVKPAGPVLEVKVGPGPELKVPAQASEVKIETKPADAKAPESKPADAKLADVKLADAKLADAKAPDSRPAEAAAAPEKADAATAKEMDAPTVELKPAPGRVPSRLAPGAPRVGVGAKRAPEAPRKATLLGIASPLQKLAEPKAAAPASEPAAKEDAAATPAPASAGEKAADSSKAAAAEAALGSKPEPNKDAKPEAPAAAEASAPASKPTPPPGSVTKPSADAEPTPGSVSPTSVSPASVGDRKKRALSGNLKPGDTLGRYELLLPVASGGMATVWAARLEGTAGFQKTVAIKTMLPGLSSDADFEEMFLDEARVAARIRHPNVVEIFDLGEEGETLYLVMEWVEGETVGALQKGAKAHGGIPAPILLRLASQVCAGLHAAHELRDDKGALVDLVHRDISPANILVSRTGFVKIVDFGVAKSKARMYTTRVGGMIKGKTPYLSPEQLAGQPIDRRSDIFSFGAVLYVLATGLHPFRGENDGKTIENIVLRDPVSLRKLEPSIPAELEAIILKALAKDRDTRWESASEMQRAIDTLAASIGQTVNDDDVAAFIKKVAGDGLEKRATALRDAIALADTGKPPIQPRQALSPEAGKESAGPPSGSAPPIDDVMKVEIDDVDVEVGGGPAKPSAVDAGAGVVAAAEPVITAPSLGSDSAPDTLAAASTEPLLHAEDAPPPRKRGPLLALGAVGGVLALAGIFALASGGGDEPARTGTASTAVAATATADALRTGAPAETATAAPSATEAPATSASATAEPTSTATAEPAPTAEPVASTPPVAATPPKGQPLIKTNPPKPTGNTVKPPAKPPAKPPKKFEPTTL